MREFHALAIIVPTIDFGWFVMIPSLQIASGNLGRAMDIFARYATTAPAKMVNRTALFVAYDAQANTPVTSMGRIDGDMGAIVKSVVPTRGVRNGETNIVLDRANSAANMITIARMHAGSKFNQLTGGRWAIPKIKTSGKQAFWNAVEVIAERMVRARHSSTGYLKHSWAAIISKLNAIVPRDVPVGVIGRENRKGMTLSGEVYPAVPGAAVVSCVIKNTIGLNAVTKEMGEKHNEAAHRVLVPVLEASMNREFHSKMEKAAKEGWLEYERRLSVLGVSVR